MKKKDLAALFTVFLCYMISRSLGKKQHSNVRNDILKMLKDHHGNEFKPSATQICNENDLDVFILNNISPDLQKLIENNEQLLILFEKKFFAKYSEILDKENCLDCDISEKNFFLRFSLKKLQEFLEITKMVSQQSEKIRLSLQNSLIDALDGVNETIEQDEINLTEIFRTIGDYLFRHFSEGVKSRKTIDELILNFEESIRNNDPYERFKSASNSWTNMILSNLENIIKSRGMDTKFEPVTLLVSLQTANALSSVNKQNSNYCVHHLR